MIGVCSECRGPTWNNRAGQNAGGLGLSCRLCWLEAAPSMGIHARHYDRNEWNRDMADNEIEARQEAFSMWATTWDVDGTGLPRGNVQTSASTSRWLPPVWVREPEGVGYDQGEQWIYDVMIWIQPPVVVVTGAERHRQAMVLLPLCDVVL